MVDVFSVIIEDVWMIEDPGKTLSTSWDIPYTPGDNLQLQEA
jgi:hypothetical protein